MQVTVTPWTLRKLVNNLYKVATIMATYKTLLQGAFVIFNCYVPYLIAQCGARTIHYPTYSLTFPL